MTGLVIGLLLFFVLIYLALIVFLYVCNWRIYEKMGVEGWKCLIPYYNSWVFFEAIGWITGGVITLIGIILPIILVIASVFISNELAISVLVLLSALSVIASCVCAIVGQIRLIQGFGRPLWYLALYLFLPIVYYALLAFFD